MTVWMGMTVRNILYGATLERLCEKHEVTIVSNYEASLKETLKEHQLSYERLKVPRWQFPSIQSVLIQWLYDWNYFALWQMKKPSTAEIIIQWERERRRFRYFFNFLGGLLVQALRKRTPDTDILRDIVYFFGAKEQLRKFDAILLSSTDLPKDQMIAYASHKNKVPLICLVHSWDNLPGRGLLATVPDKLLVWNKSMVKDAVELLGVPEEQVVVVGGPQYETYRRLSKLTNYGEFLKRLNIPSGTKIITYTAGVEWVYPEEQLLIEKLIREIDRGRFGNAILIIRLHPTDERTRVYRDHYGSTSLPVRLDEADAGFAAMNIGATGAPDSVANFVAIMQFSDVVLNVASTTTLDAILFDTPVVCPCFNFKIPDNAYNAVSKLYNTHHYKEVTKSGAIHLPRSFTQLVSDIEEAILFPERRRNQRRELSEKLTPELPTSELILATIDQTTTQRTCLGEE